MSVPIKYVKMILLLVLIVAGASGTVMAQTTANRQLLIFGKEGNYSQVEQQLRLLDSAAKEVKERNLTITVVESGDELNRKYKVPAGTFEVILIGKDGGEKHRSKKVIEMKELFAIIDAMPMRQAEMQNKE